MITAGIVTALLPTLSPYRTNNMAQRLQHRMANRISHFRQSRAWSPRPRTEARHITGALRTFAAGAIASYDSIQSTAEGAAGIITISKPKALNALSSQASLQDTEALSIPGLPQLVYSYGTDRVSGYVCVFQT